MYAFILNFHARHHDSLITQGWRWFLIDMHSFTRQNSANFSQSCPLLQASPKGKNTKIQ